MSFLMSPFKTFGKNIIDDLFMIGRNLIDALIRGIGSMAGVLSNAVKGIGSSIFNTLSNLWKISSPSKVFMGIGEDAMQGLALGLAGSERMLRNMTSGIGDAALPSIDVAGGRGGPAPIVINVTGGMMDPQGVAREVVKVLNDANRRTGAGGASLLL
jgi:phage-related protein